MGWDFKEFEHNRKNHLDTWTFYYIFVLIHWLSKKIGAFFFKPCLCFWRPWQFFAEKPSTRHLCHLEETVLFSLFTWLLAWIGSRTNSLEKGLWGVVSGKKGKIIAEEVLLILWVDEANVAVRFFPKIIPAGNEMSQCHQAEHYDSGKSAKNDTHGIFLCFSHRIMPRDSPQTTNKLFFSLGTALFLPESSFLFVSFSFKKHFQV